ncbi:MAG: P-loop NTPase fold protein [Pseudomonadota bacterium]
MVTSDPVEPMPLLFLIAETSEFESAIDGLSGNVSALRQRLYDAARQRLEDPSRTDLGNGFETFVVRQMQGDIAFVEDVQRALFAHTGMRDVGHALNRLIERHAHSENIVIALSFKATSMAWEYEDEFADELRRIFQTIETRSLLATTKLIFHIHPNTLPEAREDLQKIISNALSELPKVPPRMVDVSETSGNEGEGGLGSGPSTKGGPDPSGPPNASGKSGVGGLGTPPRTEPVKFHSDRAVASREDDDIGRAAVADSIAKSVREVWPDHVDDYKRPFAVHLAGRWGSGKSSVLTFLREALESGTAPDGSDQEKWLVVDFNAWLRQDEGTAWWAMMNAVVAGAQTGLPPITRNFLRRRYRRWLWLNGTGFRWWAPLGILSLVCLFVLFERATNPATPGPDTTYTETRTFTTTDTEQEFTPRDGAAPIIEGAELTTKVETTRTEERQEEGFWASIWRDAKTLIPILVAFFGTLGSIFGIIATVRQKQADTANTLTELNTDPAAPLQEQFKRVVEDAGRPVAIFIDDLDRCDAPYVVDLLETFQTIYAKVPVLYVVAADRDWIVSAYGQVYKDFGPDISRPGLPLGYLFVEKIFQLSVPLPDLGPDDRETLLDKLLGDTGEEEPSAPEETAVFEAQLADGFGDLETTRSVLASAKEALPRQDYAKVARLAYDEIQSEAGQRSVKHALSDFTHLMDPNPRSLKRLINDYTFRQGYLFLSGENVPVASLIHWSILSLRFPYAAREIARSPDLLDDRARNDWDKKNEKAPHTPFFADPLITVLCDGIPLHDLERLRTLG